jgi:hypothetical protein
MNMLLKIAGVPFRMTARGECAEIPVSFVNSVIATGLTPAVGS